MKIEKLKMTRMHNLFIIALSAMCVACGGKNQGRQQTVPEFAVITLQPETVKLTSAYPATFKGRQDVEIRPNVSGFITKLCVDEGSSVQKGQTLFVIDPVQYEEAVNVAKAAVEVAKANVATAELTAKNKRQLEQKIIDFVISDPSMSAEAMAYKIGISSRAVEKHISKLRSMGILSREGADHGGYWRIVINPQT